jgi:hypothetical protein
METIKKIRGKGRTGSAWKWVGGGEGGEGGQWG